MATAIVSASVTINAAISAAFNCLSDLSCHYKWNPHLELSSIVCSISFMSGACRTAAV